MHSNNSTVSLAISLNEAMEETQVIEESSFQGFYNWLGGAQRSLIQDMADRASYGDRAWGSVHPWENTGMDNVYGLVAVAHPEFSNSSVETTMYFFHNGVKWTELSQGVDGAYLCYQQ
jgi:hypothetical protein